MVQLALKMYGHRQDSVRSVVVDLHQVSSAVAELHVQSVALTVSSAAKSRALLAALALCQQPVLHSIISARSVQIDDV